MKKSVLMIFNVIFVFFTLLFAFLALVFDNKIFSAFEFISMGFMFIVQYIIHKDNVKGALGKSQLFASVVVISVGLTYLVISLLK